MNYYEEYELRERVRRHYKKKENGLNVIHGFLTIMSCMLWAPIWVVSISVHRSAARKAEQQAVEYARYRSGY